MVPSVETARPTSSKVYPSHWPFMASQQASNTTFEPERVIQPIYTGGDVVLDRGGRILASCLGEEAVLTDLYTGEALARLEGVCSHLRISGKYI